MIMLTAHASCEGEVGVGESRADEVSGVGRHVAAFMVTGKQVSRIGQ